MHSVLLVALCLAAVNGGLIVERAGPPVTFTVEGDGVIMADVVGSKGKICFDDQSSNIASAACKGKAGTASSVGNSDTGLEFALNMKCDDGSADLDACTAKIAGPINKCSEFVSVSCSSKRSFNFVL